MKASSRDAVLADRMSMSGSEAWLVILINWLRVSWLENSRIIHVIARYRGYRENVAVHGVSKRAFVDLNVIDHIRADLSGGGMGSGRDLTTELVPIVYSILVGLQRQKHESLDSISIYRSACLRAV